MMFFFSVFISLLLGFLVCHLIFSESKTINFRFLVNLSFPIGVGLSSLIFIFFNLLGLSALLVFFIEIGLVIFLIFKIKYSSKTVTQYEWFNINNSARSDGTGSSGGVLQNAILILAIGIYLYSWLMDIGIYYFDTVQNPLGLWDAWACWNLNAKFISGAPHVWPQLIHQMNPTDFAPDHPLLQKGFIARCWLLMQNESIWVPVVSSFIFTFCIIGLLSTSVSFFTNKFEGLIAGLILLCTPFLMKLGDSQYADNTVGFFYLATIVLLTFARSGASIKPRLLFAAGITAGLAAWSKSEGLLFIVCLFASQLTLLFFRDRRELLKELKYLFLGMLPILLMVAYFKIVIAPPNRILSPEGGSPFIKLLDYSRYEIAYSWFKGNFKVFGEWILNPWWLFLIGIVVKGINFKENAYSFISNFTLLVLMLLGFFFVEIITPLSLYYYLSTSVHRLLSQLFPSFIFVYFLAISNKTDFRTPRKVIDLVRKKFKKPV